MGNVLVLARRGLIFTGAGRDTGYLGYSVVPSRGSGLLVVIHPVPCSVLLINIVATVSFLIPLLFSVNCSYLNP